MCAHLGFCRRVLSRAAHNGKGHNKKILSIFGTLTTPSVASHHHSSFDFIMRLKSSGIDGTAAAQAEARQQQQKSKHQRTQLQRLRDSMLDDINQIRALVLKNLVLQWR
jgi:hypothetical protein